ncbi:PEP-CTERM sorting domain-containing protein [uncultured Pontibacter sp.]
MSACISRRASSSVKPEPTTLPSMVIVLMTSVWSIRRPMLKFWVLRRPR